jgi:uncharacterized membrane protein YeaQ/YmgE (transglycosylase-associated protein family)
VRSYPKRQPLGLIATILLGIAGSFLGGFLGSLVSERRVTDVHTVGILGSIVGAVAVLLITNVVMNRRNDLAPGMTEGARCPSPGGGPALDMSDNDVI